MCSSCPNRRAGDTLGRVLIADDDATLRLLLQAAIRTRPIDADFASDGGEALHKWRVARDEGHPYDLLVLDVFMPCMSGLGVAEAIRAAGDRTTPIAIMTGDGGPVVDMRAYSAHAMAVWIKAGSNDNIVQLIRDTLCAQDRDAIVAKKAEATQ